MTEKRLLWAWNYLKINKLMLVYFLQTEKYCYAISDTLAVLWEREVNMAEKLIIFSISLLK